ALMSRPFNLDDLEAFTYLAEDERSVFFNWLIKLPFVRSITQTGRYSYHELVQELFSRHLYQRSQKEYYAIRKALADHYQKMLQKYLTLEESSVYASIEWLELVLAEAFQLFLLPDEESNIHAIEQILDAYENSEHYGEINRLL